MTLADAALLLFVAGVSGGVVLTAIVMALDTERRRRKNDDIENADRKQRRTPRRR